MEDKILFVDDEPHILQSIKRQFRKRFNLQVAESGDEALRILKEEGPFSVIVSDMRMPGMTGVELLGRVKNLYPETVRLMLTGNADQETAVEAVNSGHVFRFLNKPCPPSMFVTSLALAQRQHRLLTAEKELLQQTLKGSINVLSEILGIANPTAFSSGLRIKRYVVQIAEKFGLPGLWQYEIAALMSQIGCVTLPNEILTKRYTGQNLSPKETEMFTGHPEMGAQLLEKIPRLENVASMITLQLTPYNEYTEKIREKVFDEVIIGAQILKVVTDYDLLIFRGVKRTEALEELRKQKGMYNQKVVNELAQIKPVFEGDTVSLPANNITTGMIAVEDVMAKNGILVIPKGQTITLPLVQGLKNFARQVGIIEPIRVRIAEEDTEEQ